MPDKTLFDLQFDNCFAGKTTDDLAEGEAVVYNREAFPVEAVYISNVDTDPFTQLGYGTWEFLTELDLKGTRYSWRRIA